MSAQANTQIQHNINIDAVHDRVEYEPVTKSATPINVTARIDYIQRFSKQMILVVDDSQNTYSQLARQYLTTISQENSKQEVNVAFVAASSKLNDIQMRCRLIEQLFANTLFNPEQSLAVSILHLLKQNNDTITIVVEHAQALSLQIKYELCQLVDIAKKTQNKINVVLFALEQAAQEIGQNQSIFDKKVSIIEASSGQVLALDHARFKNNTALFSGEHWRKISIVALLTIIVIVFSWYILTEHKNFTLTTLTTLTTLPDNQPINKSSKNIVKPILEAPALKPLNTASVADIHTALITEHSNEPALKAAEMSDILQALVITEPAEVNAKNPQVISEKLEDSKALLVSDFPNQSVIPMQEAQEKTSSNLPTQFNHQYYLSSVNGFVVQIAGFSDSTRLKNFIEKHQSLDYFSYKKILNEQTFIVLTSKVYGDKAQAKAVMEKLPQNIRDLGSFLKPVTTIKREINTVNL